MSHEQLYKVRDCYHLMSDKLELLLNVAPTQAARHAEVRKNEAQAGNRDLRCELANISNQNRSHHGKRRNGDVTEESSGNESSEENVDKRKPVELLGRKHAITMTLWLRDDRNIFKTSLDDGYNALDRFENDDNTKQGRLRDLLIALPREYRIQKKWILNSVSPLAHSLYVL
jgi:hypothetical protein